MFRLCRSAFRPGRNCVPAQLRRRSERSYCWLPGSPTTCQYGYMRRKEDGRGPQIIMKSTSQPNRARPRRAFPFRSIEEHQPGESELTVSSAPTYTRSAVVALTGASRVRSQGSFPLRSSLAIRGQVQRLVKDPPDAVSTMSHRNSRPSRS